MSYRGHSGYHSSSSASDSSDNSSNSDSDSPINNFALKALKLRKTKQSKIMSLKAEYLGMIPEFQGEAELLPRFLCICEKLVKKFYNTTDVTDFQNEYLMSSILSKIKGEAAINISSSLITTWDDLKLALLSAYADKRDIYTLNIEMTEMKQGNESPFDFYNKIQQILNLQLSYITTHSNQQEIPILSQYCRNLALRVLLRGLKEPIGSLMRTKNPLDLNSALNMLTNDFQIESMLHKAPKPQVVHNKIIRPPTQHKPPFLPAMYTPRAPFMPRPSEHVNRPQSGGSFMHRPFNNRPNHNQNFQKPTPMSGISHTSVRPFQTQNQNTNFFQNQSRNNPPKYTFEELYNIDETHESNELFYDPYSYDSSYDTSQENSNYPTVEYPKETEENAETQVFQIEASENSNL